MVEKQSYRQIVPGEKIDIAFLFQAGTVWPSWESVYEACMQEDCFNVKVVLITRKTVETAHNTDAEQFLIQRNIAYEKEEEIDFSEYIPHVVLMQFPYDAAFNTPDMLSLQFKRRGSRVVYIPYGIEIADTEISRKDHFNSRVVENAWRIYTSSDGILDEYKKYCRNRNAVRVTGSPKFDSIYNHNRFPMNSEYISKANGRKIVVWKLHFPKKINSNGKVTMITPEIEEYIEFSKKIPDLKEFFFIVMPHPKILGRMTASDSQGDDSMAIRMREMLKKVGTYENAVIDTAKDYRNSLYNADAVVMDRSAVMIEAAMLKVPVLIMKNSNYSEPMVKPVSDVISKCVQGTECDDIMSFLSSIGEQKDFENGDRRETIEKWFPFLDGKCGERIAQDIQKSIWPEEDKKNPRIVLYGTGEVATYYMNKEKWNEHPKFEIVAVSDSSTAKHGKEYYGYKIIPPEKIKELDYDYVVVMTEPHFYDIQRFLINEMYLYDRTILRLDEFVTSFLPS